MSRNHQQGPSFSTYASRLLSHSLLSTTTTPSDPPLFYSTRDWELSVGTGEDDILGTSDSEHNGAGDNDRQGGRGGSRRLSLGISEEDDDDDGLGTDPSASLTGSRGGRRIEYPGSRLWEGSALPAFSAVRNMASRGWKTHIPNPQEQEEEERRERVADVYAEFASSSSEDGGPASSRDHDLDDMDDPDSPPSFLSPLPGPLGAGSSTGGASEAVADEVVQPLLKGKTLYVYPTARRRGGNSEQAHRDSVWIAVYGLAVLATLAELIRIVWLNPSDTEVTPLLPAISTLSTLSLLSLLSSLLSLSLLLSLKTPLLRILLSGLLLLAPAGLVIVGVVAWGGSFGGESGVETDKGWKWGVRAFGTACWIVGGLMLRGWEARRKGVDRSVKVLELATEILLSHPTLLLICLGLSLVSTVISLPFFFLVSSLLHPHQLLSFSSLLILLVFLWTLEILRGLQRVTVSGVVGNWYFLRHSNERDGVSRATVVNAAWTRASSPSLGTIILSSLLLSAFSTVLLVLRRSRAVLRSSQVPFILAPLTCMVPILGVLEGLLEVFNGFVLAWTGMTGGGFWEGARDVGKVIKGNGTTRLGDNLLIKSLLLTVSTLWSLLAGLLAFFVASKKVDDPKSALLLGTLCVIVPGWGSRLGLGVLGDATDALFLAYNLDMEKNLNHCTKVLEAFGEPESQLP